MATVLLVIHLMIATALVCVVLMQKSEGGALGIGGGGGGGGFLTGRGTANLLTRTTAGLAAAFFPDEHSADAAGAQLGSCRFGVRYRQAWQRSGVGSGCSRRDFQACCPGSGWYPGQAAAAVPSGSAKPVAICTSHFMRPDGPALVSLRG